jgi:hypothetical protein
MNDRVLHVAALTAVALVSGSVPALAAPATDGPGAMSHFALARKDCVGTAQNERSKVWYTVADGVLSDVYYPTNDNTNNETLQYVVTDGSTFTDLQTRDMTYKVPALDERALSCRVTSTAKSGRYRIVPTTSSIPIARRSCSALASNRSAGATAVDVLTPAGTSQADELDYTLHSPVVLQPVEIP